MVQTATTARKRVSYAELQQMADQAERQAEFANWASLPPVAAAMGEPSRAVTQSDSARGPFGAWLVKQVPHRKQWIAQLAKAAAADTRFPKSGDPDTVRKYLNERGADGDAHEALDDAELEWLCL